MAKQYNNTNKANQANKWVEVTQGVSIRKSGNSEYFSLNWYGAIIHGCAVRNGSNGDFISFPSFKNAQGQYVKRAYVWAEPNSDDFDTLKRVLAAAKEL